MIISRNHRKNTEKKQLPEIQALWKELTDIAVIPLFLRATISVGSVMTSSPPNPRTPCLPYP